MSDPIVAIVGRPNVGKSTLFNRIIGRRDAIVDARSGVTRDRHYAIAEWCGRNMMVVDTGGYIDHLENEIDKGIRFQVEEAIDEADLILFMSDVRSGITNNDMLIGKILLKSNKPVIPVINKVDAQHFEADAGVFMKLGFGEPVTISALQGRSVGDLLDEVLDKLPEKSDEIEKDVEFSIAILGKPNVGKSSIVNSLAGKEKMLVTDIPGTTRDSIHTYIKKEGKIFKLIDTAGLRKRKKIYDNIEYYSSLRTIRSIQECQVAMIILDVQEGLTVQDMKIIEMASEAKKGMILVLNKWDLVDKDDRTYVEMEKELKFNLKNAEYIQIISTSAKTRQRVHKLLDQCESVYCEWSKKIETNILNKHLENWFKSHHPSAYRGKPVSIKYCTQIKHAPPVFVFFTNHPDGITESYKRYLNNKIREDFNFAGVPLTLEFKRK
ncbi:ribosome biogenesis GTPase Der [candidate division KSB1 bacterium]